MKRSKQDDTETVASYSLSPVGKKRYRYEAFNLLINLINHMYILDVYIYMKVV